MLKVCIHPTWRRTDKADGGIRRVSEAQWKYLSQFGIEPVYGTTDADMIATHGTAKVNVPDKPIVNHNHGLYWECHEWPAWAHEANKQVVEAMAQAVAHSAPSEWVANALRRGMLVYPEVIYHGVDADEWQPGSPQDYILWNKARADPVSNPNDMQELATHLKTIRFASTIGKATNNVKIIGTMPVDEMKEWVRNAGLYLCTARETFGIGTLEAMASGVPVVGWDWGGQSEIIKHGETGFLAKPGDYEALAEGVRWAFAHRDVLSLNARQDVLDHWGWEQRIKQYAELYLRTWDWWNRTECKVSIIVTCHNLAKYLDDCLRSVAEQDFKNWECIIVDDDSKDETPQVAKQWENIDERFRYVKTPTNLKLSGARNFGFKHSKGKYILPLDADDMLAQHALITLSSALDSDQNIHIAYGHLDTIREDGSNHKRSNGWPFQGYSWYGQMAHLNQLPYSSMMRREVMERTGGYRVRNWRAEDAAVWIHATSFGFRAAKVTQASTLIYRWRTDSKTQGEDGDGDWTAWYPWRLGAETGKQGMKIFNQMTGASHPRPDLVPWGTQGLPPSQFWPVPDHTNPFVSVVIPVGPKHDKYVIDALDSIMAQTFQRWECIVVNATGKKWPDGFESPVAGAPWAKVIDAGKQLNPAAARNLGAKHARGHAILWLDADDILIAGVLEEMVEIYLGTDGGLVYTDWLRGLSSKDSQKPLELYEAPEFECGAVIRTMQHAMMCLVPRHAHEEIGGFDESLPGWEDWDYLIALQSVGVCSYRLAKPGFVYRFFAGSIREDSFDKRDQLKPIFYEKWKDYAERKKTMPCGGCKGKRRVSIKKSSTVFKVEEAEGESAVLLEYQGPREGKVHRRGPVTGTYYIFRHNQPKYVDSRDAQRFLQSTLQSGPEFVQVAKPRELEPAIPQNFIQAEVIDAQKPLDLPTLESDTPKIEMPETIKALSEVIDAQDKQTIYNWLEQEKRKEKPRKGALKLLENAIQ